MFGGAFLNDPIWGPSLVPNDPNGSFPAFPATYPFGAGPNGAVSISHNLRGNFCFVDGHSKSMIPTSTNPDPNNQPQNDMWNAAR
jgi:prepilin-type processing-associated H-X9-DG protein